MNAEAFLVNSMGFQVLSPSNQPIRAPRNGAVDPRDVGVFAVSDARKEGEAL